MPTGAGKSLCYQLPAIIKEGVAVVISPLIALMKNQVDQLNALNVKAYFLNSTLNKTEVNKVKKETLSGHVKMLYVAPESLTKEENIAFLRNANVSFVAVDEAHCISEWGHDFRPEYRKIKSIIGQISSVPIIALTATATPKVQLDIQRNLQMEAANVFVSSFNRENLFYEVRPKKQAKKQLIHYIKQHQNKAGIVYCLSRKKVLEIAELLNVNGIKAAPYHAGLESAVRMKNQDDFLNEEVDVIVATIAFGMGIDKPDVRFVIHYDVPKSLEGYYQETGRAGRDGLEGNCLMFFSYNDITKLEKFHKDKPVTERENAQQLLQEMVGYAESGRCRKRLLLHYFGEYMAEDCGMCDNCRHPNEKYEGGEMINIAIRAALETDERFDANHLINVIRGVQNEHTDSYHHTGLAVFGKGAQEDEITWKSVIRQAMLEGFLEKDIDKISILKVTDKGHAFIQNPYDFKLIRNHSYDNISQDEEQEGGGTASSRHANFKSYDEKLFIMLKDLRRQISKKKNLPPYVIFQEPSLEEMATTYPRSREELIKVNGVGSGKAMKFGRPFIELIARYVEENNIETAAEMLIKTSAQKSKSKVFIIQQIDRKVDLEEIAASRSLSFPDLLDEIEHICYAGTKLNLDYYIDLILDDDRQDELNDYFMSVETDDIEEALDELGDDFSEEEVRLMRIKFMSDHAN